MRRVFLAARFLICGGNLAIGVCLTEPPRCVRMPLPLRRERPVSGAIEELQMEFAGSVRDCETPLVVNCDKCLDSGRRRPPFVHPGKCPQPGGRDVYQGSAALRWSRGPQTPGKHLCRYVPRRAMPSPPRGLPPRCEETRHCESSIRRAVTQAGRTGANN